MIYNNFAQVYNQFVDSELLKTYVKVLQKHQPSGTILDLGTGTGQLAVKLQQKGYVVHATDTSESMLEIAMNNAVEHGVHIQFFVHDITLPIQQLYDGITMSSDVINYLSDLEQMQTAFKHIQQAMHQDSIFIFDVLRLSYIKQMDHFSKTIPLDDQMLQWTVVKTNNDNQIKHTITMDTSVETHIQTTYSFKRIKAVLEQENFEIIEKHKTKERFILVCKIHP